MARAGKGVGKGVGKGMAGACQKVALGWEE